MTPVKKAQSAKKPKKALSNRKLRPGARIKIDPSKIKKENPPLGIVVQALAVGKTARDSGAADISQDIAIALEARDPNSRLAKALDNFAKGAGMPKGKTIAGKSRELLKELEAATSKPDPRQ